MLMNTSEIHHEYEYNEYEYDMNMNHEYNEYIRMSSLHEQMKFHKF